jgi:hypothetical protein
MYALLDKEKPGIGSIGGLHLAVARPTTVRMTNCSFRVVTYVKTQQTGEDLASGVVICELWRLAVAL